jgi:hypothetical protein
MDQLSLVETFPNRLITFPAWKLAGKEVDSINKNDLRFFWKLWSFGFKFFYGTFNDPQFCVVAVSRIGSHQNENLKMLV